MQVQPHSVQPHSLQPHSGGNFVQLRQTMVDCQIKTFNVVDPFVIERFLAVPREVFLPPHLGVLAYTDKDVRIPFSNGQKSRTLLAPLVLARLIQNATVNKKDRVLDIGGGAGYTAALLAGLAHEIVALETDSELTAQASANLLSLKMHHVSCITGDLTAGAPEHGPYDVILVNGALQTEPEILLKQLREGGRLVAFHGLSHHGLSHHVRHRIAHAILYKKNGGQCSKLRLFDGQAAILPEFSNHSVFAF